MNEKRSVTLNGLVLPNAIFVGLSIIMILLGAYLTNHYYQVMFPSGIDSGTGLCNISEFWGCDNATKSGMGTLLGVPTSIFAIVIGICGIFAAFAGSPGFEKTIKTVLALNLVACSVLFIYSLVALGSLCPMCTAYYIVSALAFFIFFKKSDYGLGVDPKALGVFAAILLIPSVGAALNIKSKVDNQSAQANSFITQFNALKGYGKAPYESPYKLHMSTKNFDDAPIRVTLFSDFQCPFCQSVASQFDDIMEEYKDKINVQYMFYPLDIACNKDMQRSLHAYACDAAYLAACDVNKFKEVHDHLFANQKDINTNGLRDWEKKFGLSGCFKNADNQDVVQQTLNAGKFYKLKSTPTMIINGKKIEGGIDSVMLRAILDSIIK